MSISIVWSSEFETGIDIIDQQHRRMFEYFEEIETAIKQRAPERVERVVRNLIDYAFSHITFEEGLMEKANYPLLDVHRKVHESFRTRVLAWAEKLQDGADPLRVAMEVRTDVGLWLINHITHEDKHYAPYVKKALAPGLVARMTGKLFGNG